MDPLGLCNFNREVKKKVGKSTCLLPSELEPLLGLRDNGGSGKGEGLAAEFHIHTNETCN
jgi:hypothetical protein